MERRKRNQKPKKRGLGKKILISVSAILVILIAVGAIAATKIYLDVKGTADGTYKTVQRSNRVKTASTTEPIAQKKPFTVLLLGVDTGALGRNYKGRSDSMMLMAVNPSTKTTKIVSLERDSYVKIVGNNTFDKLNHAYAFGGPAMAMDTVENLLGVSVDHYVTINMGGIETLVDALGGVDVNNTLEFTYENSSFALGNIHLDGTDALKYTRMRYDDPKGDYGRQERQRKVIEAIAKKALTMQGVTKYKSILDSMKSNLITDVSFDEMIKIANNYRSSFESITTDQLQGTGFTGDGTTGEQGISYQRISDTEIARIKKELNEQLAVN